MKKNTNPGEQLNRTIQARKSKARKGLENYLFHVNDDKKKVIVPDVDFESGLVTFSDSVDFAVGQQLFFSQVTNAKEGIYWSVHRWYRFRLNVFQYEQIRAWQARKPVKFADKGAVSGQDIQNLFGQPEINLSQVEDTTREDMAYTRETVNIVDFWAFWTSGYRPKPIDRKEFETLFKNLLFAWFDNPAGEGENEKQGIKILL